MRIYELVQQLVNEGEKRQLIKKEDKIYVRNQLLALLQLDTFSLEQPLTDSQAVNVMDELVIPELVEQLVEYACQHNIIEDFFDSKEIFSAKIMNCFIARPSEINEIFRQKYKESPSAATNYFYSLSKNSNYIQMKRIRKNIKYKVPTEFGELDITVNLSKPEKDPKQIEKEKNSPKQSGYPTCVLCVENEGYAGRLGYAARSNHRMIRIPLKGENWFLQYSPYVYYNEHCILLSENHRNMQISRETFRNLLLFVERFPHYFLGSNADLPIVGGSILSHDHYQGGCYDFPMAKATSDYSFTLNRYSEVECSIVKWPMTVIRLRANQKEEIIDAANYILGKWKNYSDEQVNVLAFTNDTPHNTITPIARIKNGKYEMDLVLRNNRTNEEHPLGIFHPHADVHHIKKENIGLIEVMGLAVLPARLKEELVEVEKYILEQPNKLKEYHLPWAEKLKLQYASQLTEQNVSDIVKDEVGKIFLRVLLDASVFKRDAKGKQALQAFIHHLNNNYYRKK
ncbi:UDP-glucose--hexose-1-phosphate uridylyltransferase [Caldibacillus lycopersici]|uniref:Galactose-1-phosphate uridylyltransferase n=1 Tax=Perspicuibacillus lycopersici TaxID=1325689 RepID=A0AAE3IV72_9BACI|nr:UDP-glucose--hexose-1-phosphate uridylyltransferase [Perspicuibacillus lycopersici]MCU9615136.1 UDP-glucose--hexose-1-phosphate uridylyltransferase [Perspicuibacillus lycopersici]